METKYALELHNVSFSFAQGGSYFFKDLCVQFQAQKIHFITGRNGVGKSLLLRLLQGQVGKGEIADGTVIIDGIAYQFQSNELAQCASIGVVHQKSDLMLADQFSVAENLALANLGTYPAIGALPKTKPLPDFLVSSIGNLHKPVHLLSGGQRQMLAIMMKLQKQIKILLLDEPTAALDDDNAMMVMDFVQQLVQASGVTVLMICHDQELMKRYDQGNVYRIIKDQNDVRNVVM